jgi:osmoprotectant transport system substrate-binding protein
MSLFIFLCIYKERFMKFKPYAVLALVTVLLTTILLAACGDATNTVGPAATTAAAPAATTAAAVATTAATSTTAAATTAATATTAAAATTSAAATTAAATSAAATTAATTTTAASTASGTTAAATSAAATTAASGTSSAPAGTIVVGSKNFTESILTSEMYAQALEAAGFKVTRKFDLGTTDIAQAALVKGDIGLYPEYTGTALLNVLKETKDTNDPKAVYDKVAAGYLSKFNLVVLDPAPMNDTNGIAVTKAVADKYNLKTLSDLSKVADQLRFAAIPDFIGPRSDTDGLGSLQKTYGGFKFKETKSYEIGLRYQALLNNQADAVVAFSTDGEISGYGLVLLQDDKQNFPPYQFAPVVRQDVLTANPKVKDVLNAVSAKVTTDKISALNWQVDGPQKMEAQDVAKAFLQKEGILK